MIAENRIMCRTPSRIEYSVGLYRQSMRNWSQETQRMFLQLRQIFGLSTFYTLISQDLPYTYSILNISPNIRTLLVVLWLLFWKFFGLVLYITSNCSNTARDHQAASMPPLKMLLILQEKKTLQLISI